MAKASKDHHRPGSDMALRYGLNDIVLRMQNYHDAIKQWINVSRALSTPPGPMTPDPLAAVRADEAWTGCDWVPWGRDDS